MYYSEPVIVNSYVLFWASCCESRWLFWASGYESCCVILSQELWIMECYAKPSGCESWTAMLSPVVVNHNVLFWGKWVWIMMCYDESNGWESWCAIPNQRLWIKGCYAGPVVVNHGLLGWDSGCESLCILLNQWLWIMMCYAEPCVVNHGVLFWASDWESR